MSYPRPAGRCGFGDYLIPKGVLSTILSNLRKGCCVFGVQGTHLLCITCGTLSKGIGCLFYSGGGAQYG